MRDIRTIKEIVEYLLINKPETKDNDKLLIIEVWKIELVNLGFNPKNIDLNIFFDVYLTGKISNHESITRCRRKLQEEIINLRGITFNQRQSYTKEVKKQVKKFFESIDYKEIIKYKNSCL